MANLTITVDDEALKRARIRALEQGTSVNALLSEYLNAFAGTRPTQVEALEDLMRLSRTVEARRGGARWTRDELHERR